MSPMAVILQRTLPAGAEAVPHARNAVRQALDEAGVTDRDLHDAVALTVTEATANAVRHAYPGSEEGQVDITVSDDGGWLVINVDDRGVGFQQPEGASAGAGFGLTLMRANAAQFSVQSGSGGTLITMRFERPR